ncbi:MAG TPA: M1 family metallopeptidase, partial [Chitinophagales bacterium]|nr:M1 family metallopeptidase [Chitinophagales bacterium]
MITYHYKLVIILLFICSSSTLLAQKEQAYWQQEVNYSIQVSLDDSTHFLNGNISMEYINHSPDTLRYIWFHLWPNAYKNTETAFAKQELENGNTDFQFSREDEKGYIDQLDFRINGNSAATNPDPEHIDITKLLLNEPLLPGRSITITTPFRVKIPKTFSRLGHIGQSYQVTQWYPKPAVYDRFGWHPIPYLDQGEFYSEFGSFNVSITLPVNYVVGATGTLLNEGEKKWMDSLAVATAKKFEATSSATALPTPFEKKDTEKFPPSATRTKTLEYTASKVHDFAWFADKRYHVMKSHVSLSNKDAIITTWTLFLDKHAAQWKNAIHFVDSSVIYYSKWVGDYPYPQATAVEGALEAGDGMEYPMITVVSGGFGSNKSLETVVAHEVGHNWFYGILAFNEREHPWMDEGINSYYENRYVETRYRNDGLVPDINPIAKTFDLTSYTRGYQNYLIYAFQAYRHLDQPMDLNASDFTYINYGGIVYAKTAIVFKYLEAYLGTAMYDALMQQFYQEWAFRHPYPIDLKNFFETNTQKELDWFFEQTIETKDYLDYKLVKVGDTTTIGNSTFQKLVVKNKADIKGPYSITALKNGKAVNELWLGGFKGKMEVLFPQGDYDAFRIDEKMELPEVNRKNNYVRTSGLFPNVEKFRLQWLGSLDNPQRTQLFFTPTAGWNNYDKFWLGLAFYNSFLPGKPLSFAVMPAYGFGSNRIIGAGEVNLQLFPKTSFIRRIDINSSAKSFDYISDSFYGDEGDNVYRFMKFTQEVQLGLRKSEARSPVNQSFTYRNIYVLQEAPESFYSHTRYGHQFFNQLTYALQNKRVLNPFGLSLSLEQGTAEGENFYLKTFLEGNYTITYPRKKHGIDLRLFTGLMLAAPEEGTFAHFHLGPTTGIKDYRFDEVYLGRTASTGFLSQQVAVEEGGFKMRTDGVQPELGGSNSWLLALNAKVPLPFFSPIFVFGDAGLAPNDGAYQDFQFDAGVGITIIPDVVEVYLPLIFSSD